MLKSSDFVDLLKYVYKKDGHRRPWTLTTPGELPTNELPADETGFNKIFSESKFILVFGSSIHVWIPSFTPKRAATRAERGLFKRYRNTELASRAATGRGRREAGGGGRGPFSTVALRFEMIQYNNVTPVKGRKSDSPVLERTDSCRGRPRLGQTQIADWSQKIAISDTSSSPARAGTGGLRSKFSVKSKTMRGRASTAGRTKPYATPQMERN
ncbi:hypothetical protein EVAR_92991_1 [Eumeta japonica]|uniref:Uncharacterized protein n=1 Tax=Eumeta variegata TaxID=151549 RepID=A0A4C1TDM8_EUMVA|nr:hypothetical protein EVAR_92991_1 [Eumeta japonica]